jgi:hypothetical protein
MSKLRVFQLPAPTKDDPRPVPKEWEEPITIAGDGDQAKKAAMTMLKESGFDVRSMNWGPDANPTKAPVLIAYVAKKEV